MKVVFISDENKQFIQDNYLKMSQRLLSEATGLGESVINRFMKKNGLSVSKELALQFRVQAMTGRTTFTPEQDDYIKAHYLEVNVNQMAIALGRSETGVNGRLKAMGLVRPPELIAKHVAASRIKAGDVPPNKGKKQTDFMSADAIARTAATRFQKGNVPPNTKEQDGTITIRNDHIKRGGKPYQYIRLSLGNWKQLHVHLWEQANGPVPNGYILWFVDGNTLNCELDNLELITRQESMQRNTSANLSDNAVASYLSKKSKKVDNALKAEVLKHPELIDLKRNQLLLNRAIKNHGKTTNRK